MTPIVLMLAVMLVVVCSPRLARAAVPPDPFDPDALDPEVVDHAVLDVVLTGVERVGARDLQRLRDEASQLWAAAGVTLGWPERPQPGRPFVEAQIDWRTHDEAPASQHEPLGWIPFVDGRPSGKPIVLSAAAALALIRDAPRDGPSLGTLPPVLRNRLLMRVLARVLAHEIGHYLLGPGHTETGLMRTRFSSTHLLAPSPGRYRPTPAQTARLRSASALGAP